MTIKYDQDALDAMTLDERLEHLARSEPDRFKPESIERVRARIQYEAEHPYIHWSEIPPKNNLPSDIVLNSDDNEYELYDLALNNEIFVGPSDSTIKDEQDKTEFSQEVFLRHLRQINCKGKTDLNLYTERRLGDVRRLGLSKWKDRVANYVRRLVGRKYHNLDPAQIKSINLRQNGLRNLRGIEVFKNLKRVILSENPYETLEGIEALQELEIFSMGLYEPPKGYKLRLTGLDKLPNLRSMNYSPMLSGHQQDVDLEHWDTVKVLQNLSDRGLLDLRSQMRDVYKHHYFKHFVMECAQEDAYLDPDSAVYRRIITRTIKQLAREKEKGAFEKYKALMDAIGFKVRGARSLDDYAHINETVNGIPSLNLTVFIEDIKRKESRFVKFYTSKRVCEKDAYIQRLLASTGLVNECGVVDLSREGLDDLTTAIYGEQESRLRYVQDASVTTFADRVTIARDNQGRKLGYALVTDTINGQNMMQFADVIHYRDDRAEERREVEAILYDVTEAIMSLHEKASEIISISDAVIPVRDYGKDSRTILFGEDAGDELAKRRRLSSEDQEFSDAMDIVFGRLECYTDRKEYASFVHGDMKLDNIMRDESGKFRFIDFERCSVGALNVEDLVKLYDYALARERGAARERGTSGVFYLNGAFSENNLFEGLADAVKDNYFRKAFGDEYNREECEEMFALARAMHHIEKLDHYAYRISTCDKSSGWEQKKQDAVKAIKESLQPYMHKGEIDKIINHFDRMSENKTPEYRRCPYRAVRAGLL